MRPHVELIDEKDLLWHPAEMPHGEGEARQRNLCYDEENGAASLLVEFVTDWSRGARLHTAQTIAAWAEQGDGRYFAANDQSGLSGAIEEALRVPYAVYDQSGTEVAAGQVGGEPIAVEQGRYTVMVRTQPPQRFEAVDVEGEAELTLTLE